MHAVQDIFKYEWALVLIVFLFINIRENVCQDCESKETCGQCIQELNCYWCTNSRSASHCQPVTDSSSCSNKENPTRYSHVTTNNELSESQQIKPQRIKLVLRRNEKFEIQFKYKQSKNYPVDLYYIMDLSNSMKTSKDKLGTLGKRLANEMKRKTDDFKIGFGSFVDKLALPFVNTHPDALRSPCKTCAPPYSFKNQLSLTPDAGLFSTRVTETAISGNLDTPEGGFDAIMQAIVCTEEIGWRPNARHLLVMSTDAVSHIAGDGKLGGVIEPNNGECFMVNNTYTHGLVYDYPSVSHINYVARQNNINIIFAIVTDNAINSNSSDYLKYHYKSISESIENSKMGTLEKDSDNVVKFISEIYDQIRDSVKISSNAPKDVNINITSNCASYIDGSCSSVKPGQVLDFKAIIQPLECHDDASSNKKIIKIKPEGLEDSLIIELQVTCECNCANSTQRSSAECLNYGDLECGICRCQEGRFGAKCQCDRTQSEGEDPSLCIKPHGEHEICSGQGTCICGKCQCKTRQDENEHIYGKYCECDDFSCPLKCSGQGKCDCGVCTCNKGWTGSGCDCSTDESFCIAPGTKEICSGHGDCVCGQCQCKTDSERHSGRYCEECTSCPAQRCDELRPCVECQAYRTGIYANNSECQDNCKTLALEIVDKLEENPEEGVKRCRVLVEDDCTISFQYSYDENKNLVVKAQQKKICPEPPNILAWIIGIVASVILIGIVTLIIWKVLTTIHDKKEYAKFEAERNQLKWHRNENPLYKPGTTNFLNPSYKRASQRISLRNDKTIAKPQKPEPQT